MHSCPLFLPLARASFLVLGDAAADNAAKLLGEGSDRVLGGVVAQAAKEDSVSVHLSLRLDSERWGRAAAAS